MLLVVVAILSVRPSGASLGSSTDDRIQPGTEKVWRE
jgi:hypothetical protein